MDLRKDEKKPLQMFCSSLRKKGGGGNVGKALKGENTYYIQKGSQVLAGEEKHRGKMSWESTIACINTPYQSKKEKNILSELGPGIVGRGNSHFGAKGETLSKSHRESSNNPELIYSMIQG